MNVVLLFLGISLCLESAITQVKLLSAFRKVDTVTLISNDPERFVDDAIEGFCDLHPGYVTRVPGGVVRSQESKPGKVAVVVGGGSGHYPAFYGIVGPGFADGAVVGNVFTSPSSKDALSVASAAHNGGGVVITSGNYAGDVLHFTEAAEQLVQMGIQAKTLFVTDDIASAPVGNESTRRGIAGGFAVFKFMSAAAEMGYSLEAVVRVGQTANRHTRTLGLAFSGCTLPGAPSPLFTVPKGKMAVGLGIHGEPGISEDEIPSAKVIARRLVDDTIAELDLKPGSKVAVILNGLGSTKQEELFVLWNDVRELLEAHQLQVVEPEVGELVTSLDMAGLSLTVVALDDELEGFWRLAADTPAFKKNGLALAQESTVRRVIPDTEAGAALEIAACSEWSQQLAKSIVSLLRATENVLIPAEIELGRIDAVAGDGDHGRGMVKGIKFAIEGAEEALALGAGARQILEIAGSSWSGKAGGTSGALWGAALSSMGKHFEDNAMEYHDSDVLAAVTDALSTIVRIGKAKVGDKTMIDALSPFVSNFGQFLSQGEKLGSAWAFAAASATKAAEETSSLTPKIGRARPLGEKSVGTPDAGATSLAMILVTIGFELMSSKAEQKE